MVHSSVAFLLAGVAVFHRAGSAAKLTAQELRNHMRDVLIALASVACAVVMVCAVSIAFDIHETRINEMLAFAEMRQDLDSRIDSALWKADTGLKSLGLMEKSLSNGITQVRVQVQQAQNGQEQAIKAAAQTTQKAVTQTLEAAKEIQQSAPAPIVNVQAAKVLPVAPPQVVVNPVITDQPKTAIVKQPPAKVEKSRWGWLHYLWPFHARSTKE